MSNFATPWTQKPTELLCPWHFPGKNTRVVTISFSRESSRPRGWTCTSCVGRWILYCWATRKAQWNIQFSSFLSLSHFRLFATPWTAALQASLSISNSWSLLKLVSIASALPSNHCILCHPLLLLPSVFPSIRIFSSESGLLISGQSIGVSASASVLPVNIQDWFPLGLTGLLSLQSKELSRVFSSTTFKSISSLALSFTF